MVYRSRDGLMYRTPTLWNRAALRLYVTVCMCNVGGGMRECVRVFIPCYGERYCYRGDGERFYYI